MKVQIARHLIRSFFKHLSLLLCGRFGHSAGKDSKPMPAQKKFTAAALLLSLAGLSSLCGPALAQPAATPQDTMAQRMQACTVCHGKEGRASNSGYFPRIAGKPAGYLFHQLLNFRDGRRHNVAMNHLVEHLSDDYLREIAGYFAALELPYPPGLPSTAPGPLLARGEQLVRKGDASLSVPACVACHGERMTGALPTIPGLLGLPRDYLIGQMGAWRTGLRRAHAPDCMSAIAKRLSASDVAAVATWLSAQTPPVDTRPAASIQRPLPLECGSDMQP